MDKLIKITQEKADKNHNQMKSFWFFLVGIPVAFLVFWGLWTGVSFLAYYFLAADSLKGLLSEILWLLNCFLPFFLFGAFIQKIFPKFDIKQSIWITVPMVVLLLFLASMSDVVAKEYIPRFIWVLSPLVAFILGNKLLKRQTIK